MLLFLLFLFLLLFLLLVVVVVFVLFSPPFFSGDRQALEEHRPCKVTLLTLNAVIMLMIQDARSLKMVQFILSFFVYIL